MTNPESPPPIEIYAFSDRSYEQYLDFLSLSEDHLKNKKVLDVGAGLSDFVEGVNERLGESGTRAVALDLNYDVISDPDFLKKLDKRKGWIELHRKTGVDSKAVDTEGYEKLVAERIRKINEKMREHPEWFVAGDRKQLPFGDESFDLVLYNNSIYPALNHEENNATVMQCIKEGLRVISKHGQIRIMPSGLGYPEDNTPDRLSQYEHFIRVQQRDFDEKRESFDNPEMLYFYQELERSGMNFYIIQHCIEKTETEAERWVNGSLVITKDDHQFELGNVKTDGEKIRVMKLELHEAEPDDCVVPLLLIYESVSSPEDN